MSAEAVRLTLDKPVYGGDCLARLDRKAVFVPLTLPGETVSARIVESRKGFSRAEVEAVLTPSPDRIAPACPHFGACGGCHLQHASYPAQLALKRQVLRDTLTRAGVALPANIDTLAGEPWGYRNRIRLAAASRTKSSRLPSAPLLLRCWLKPRCNWPHCWPARPRPSPSWSCSPTPAARACW
jgi:tRNA/tmRNA/rRNA uracil-C5-methylase (TrmA/RlmC/RlmD family)